MILEPHAGTNEPFEADVSGANFILTADLSAVVVDFVVPDALAAEAGVVEGHVVVAINDQPVQARPVLDLRPRFRREGERVNIIVLPDGSPRKTGIVTRRLVQWLTFVA